MSSFTDTAQEKSVSESVSSTVKTIAVYCASSIGNQKAYIACAQSLGRAMGKSHRDLVYGGGSNGLMGVISGTVLEGGSNVTGVVPYSMLAAGGEGQGMDDKTVVIDEKGREGVQTIIVNTMHERKVEMARRADAFIGLPGGFGTYEEILEVMTWTQLGIHRKPVLLLNVLNFYDPLRALVKNGVSAGFIRPQNGNIVIFVDGPSDHVDHETFDWGTAAFRALDAWKPDDISPIYNWKLRKEGVNAHDPLEAS
ncbi:hypothetical protein FISHEDRAFT_73893 [Fistulina hepatica ATCC 64428]|uniref:Cytokinin riboside 5'-monophosphate phosphoribohydrolase n=1 Tax=Fistulina hepatica ATCC 64428 TaxID=1128425 RepID=A0A0D7AD81_9AGAR|nr:hypothetical protein FISHEDRAFT_73893 [Fistulina hepatica ATCC 64428]